MKKSHVTEVLLSADDRTGALEIGGLVATAEASVPVGPLAASERCCVVDIATRHLDKVEAQARMAELLERDASHRSHKMDAGLRGNWAHEVEVLLQAGFGVAIVCAFPDAGRRCKDGVVYIHDLPVLDSVFGKDPLNAPVSSRPAEVLEHHGVRGDVVVWDANDNAEMRRAVARCHEEGRVLVGASGALGAFAHMFFPSAPATVRLPKPRVVLCGSLNPLSRAQIAALGVPVEPQHDWRVGDSPVVLATPLPDGEIDDAAAVAMARLAARAVRARWREIGTLLVIGGDTAAAVVGDDTLEAIGTVAPGIPACRYQGLHLVTKGGGIGGPETIAELMR